MWATLTSDFKEFVSGVADETTNVVAGDEIDASKLEASASNEVARLRNLEATYSNPLESSDVNIKAFLESFDFESKENEIKSLLAEYPDSVNLFFQKLVPASITEKEFWQRYFYRCDEQRVAQQLRKEDEEKRQARAEAINAGINKVSNIVGGASNLVGGALTAVSQKLKNDEPSKPSSGTTFKFDTATTSAKGLNIFGTSGRPPFVMNTVVDDDDDKKHREEEEEEEEELGWDDDDDFDADDDEEQKPEAPIETSKEATAVSAVLPDGIIAKLQEQLSSVVSERDQLKSMNESQAQEIAALRGEETQKEDSTELGQLKAVLVEKDLEIATLREGLKDLSADTKEAAVISSLENEVDKLSREKSNREEQLQAALKRVTELEAKVAFMATELSNANGLLRNTIEKADDYEKEVGQMKQLVTEMKIDHDSQMQQKQAEFETQLKAGLAKVREESDAMLKQKEAEFEAKAELGTKEIERDASPSSFSTGVNVGDAAATASAIEIDEDDGWGDDGWGDDG